MVLNRICLHLIIGDFVLQVFQCTALIHGHPLKTGYDSHTSPNKKELVIFNRHHILPSYIVHYRAAISEFKYIVSSRFTKSIEIQCTLCY